MYSHLLSFLEEYVLDLTVIVCMYPGLVFVLRECFMFVHNVI
jgi:hypothetical protein